MCFTQPCSLYTHSYVCLYTALFALHTFIYEYFYTVLLAITHINLSLHSRVRRYTHSYVFSQACSPLHTFVCLYTGLFAIAHIHISLHRPVCRYL